MVQRKTRRFAGFTDDVMPADCGLDFEDSSSAQSPAITGRTITEVVTVSLADSTDDCTGIRTGNEAKLQGARKCQRLPPQPQQDDRISTRNAHRPEHHLRSHNIFRPSTIGT